MKNDIHHIGLQVIEKDLQPFYIEILGCIPLRTFNLSKEEAFSIFNIKKDVEVIYCKCNDIELELFVVNNIKIPTFNHICFHTDNATELINKAKMAGFRLHIREKKDKTKTYFVCDSNYNLFEIKTIKQ